MLEIWVERGVLERMAEEATARYPLETGGILVGYRADSSQVISEMIPSGPHALHATSSFHPDHHWQCEQLDKIYFRSARTWVYLGDWHTHPGGATCMSRVDRATLSRIAGFTSAGASNPLMVIGAGSPSQWKWRAHVYGRGVLGLVTRITSSNLKCFNAVEALGS